MTYQPYFVHGAERQSRWVVTCDHATNVVPPAINGGDLGLPAADMTRHIASDPGAYGVARALGEILGAPVVASNFSRLVIDPNRGEDDPTLIMQLYDGSIIPANRHVDAAERERRLDMCYRPYHAALDQFITGDVAVISVHSFTRQLRGRPPRPWEIGVLYPDGERLSPQFIKGLVARGDLCVGDNQPYTGYLPGDAIDSHATANGLHNTLIELRNDLIAEERSQRAWAKLMAPLLESALDAV